MTTHLLSTSFYALIAFVSVEVCLFIDPAMACQDFGPILTLWLIFTCPGLIVVMVRLNESKAELVSNKTVASVTNGSSNKCYETFEDFDKVLLDSKFWLEGVGVTTVGVLGVVGNAMTMLVLWRVIRSKINVNFNKLLICLSVVDTLLILDFILEISVMRVFNSRVAEPMWYREAFPYLIHPARGILQTTVIFMIVAVSVERFRAVCYPLSHRTSSRVVSSFMSTTSSPADKKYVLTLRTN